MEKLTMGQRIAQQRKALGLSQEGLGDRMGVSRQAISKWESDGAVPEIDKLIALSKLFSVSVGWLLGVEESAPQQAEELTEAQMKMVEEIVKKYQPKPEPRKKDSPWFYLALAFLFLFPIVFSIVMAGRNNPTDYSGQISSLQSNYQSIQSGLQSLSSRVEDLALAAEEGEKVLHSHEFNLLRLGTGSHTLEPVSEDYLREEDSENWISLGTATIVDVPIAELTFNAVPKARVATDRAFLVVMQNGQPLGQVECTWAGAGYQAEFSLWLEDGYEYRFVVEHEDGTQQIEMLEEYTFDALAYATSLHCYTEMLSWRYDSRLRVFEVEQIHTQTEKPGLGDHADTQWQKCGLILTLNGAEIANGVSTENIDPWNADVYDLVYSRYDYSFREVKIAEGDELKLSFYAALDSGLSINAPIGTWTMKEDGLILRAEE